MKKLRKTLAIFVLVGLCFFQSGCSVPDGYNFVCDVYYLLTGDDGYGWDWGSNEPAEPTKTCSCDEIDPNST